MRSSVFWISAALLAVSGCVGAVYKFRPELFSPVTGKIESLTSSLGKGGTGPAAGGPSNGQVATEKRQSNDAPRASNGRGTIVVEVAAARQAKTASDIRAIGSLLSDEAVQIAPEIAGRVAEIAFKEGEPVKAGDVLVKLDDALAVADVADARARMTLASANNDRAVALSRTGNVTGRVKDEAVSNFQTSQAALELAQTRLAKHVLRAPFDGVVGVRTMSVGAFVNIGAPIVNLEKIDLLKLDFKVPENLLRMVGVGQKVDVTVDALPGRAFVGEIYAINPLVDVNGRALQLRARLNNTDGLLRPGLFARVVIRGVTEREVVLIPESAVVPKGGDTYVFRVESGKAYEKRVRLGERLNAEVEVIEGLEPKAIIVTAGQQKLHNGSDVAIENPIGEEKTPALPREKIGSDQPSSGSG